MTVYIFTDSRGLRWAFFPDDFARRAESIVLEGSYHGHGPLPVLDNSGWEGES